jgi:hypothetical protein
MDISMKRVAAVTAALAVTGFVCGGAIGALVLSGMVIRETGVYHFASKIPQIAYVGLAYGGAAGALLTPPMSWLLLRRVSLGRALRETALGALLFAGLALAIAPAYTIAAAVGGFVVAALRLRIFGGSSRLVTAGDEPAQLEP